jgi:alpha-mannosidase
VHANAAEIRERAARTLRERLIPRRYRDHAEVEVTAWDAPGEPVAFEIARDAAYRPVPAGERWGAPWSTRWWHVTGALPRDWDPAAAELVCELGFEVGWTGFQLEGLARRADGRALKGLHPRARWVPVDEVAGPDGRFELFIEMAANPRIGDGAREIGAFAPTPLGSLETAGRDPLYRYVSMTLGLRDLDVEELIADLEVASQLEAELPDGSTRSWQLLRAVEDALDELDTHDITGTAARARAALAPALAAPAPAGAHRVSAVGHSHIDSAWLWPFRETRRKVVRTVSNVLWLLDHDPDFVYAMSSAQQYAWLAEDAPELFERIRPYVDSGRFIPVGGMWVESDINMPSGESLVRQLVEGAEFFADELGVAETGVAWLPDSFGYSAAVPQLLRLAGARRFVTQKLSWNTTNRFPHHSFLWEGIDGSRVLAHFPSADTYSSELRGAELAHAERNFADKAASNRSLLPFGYGDGGGGPTREMMARARRLAGLEGSPAVTVEPPAAFFDALEAEHTRLPVWSGELYLEFHRGVLTSVPATKAGNREAERALGDAEEWAATATVRAGAADPTERLRAAWRRLLLLQFHDVLPGSSIAWVNDDAAREFAAVIAEADAVRDAARAALGAGAAADAAGASSAHVASSAAPVALTDDRVLDNGVLRAELAPDGTVGSIRDLRSGRELLAAGTRGNLLQLHPDAPNRFDAWDLDAFYRNRCTDIDGVESIDSGTDADGSAWVRVRRAVSATSSAQQVTRLRPGADRLEFETTVDWHESERILKAGFEFAIAPATWAAETQFGHVHRPTTSNTSWEAAMFEACAHRFVHLAEPGFGIALLNDRTYGHEARRTGDGDGTRSTVVRLSLLRSPRFPDPRADAGRFTFRYAVMPATAPHDALEAAVAFTARAAGPADPLVRSLTPGVAMDAVKLALDGSGDVVVRLHNATEAPTVARIAARFAAASAAVADLRERPQESIVLRDGVLERPLRPFEVLTLRFAPVPALIE